MNIVLLDLENMTPHYLNKEMNGGLGRRIILDKSLRSWILMKALKRLFHTPPIALAYMGAIFEQRNYHVSLYPDVNIPADTDVAIFQSSIADYKSDLEAAQTLRRRIPNIKIGFTGAFPTFLPDIYKETADFIICGEPEAAAQKLFDSVQPSGIIKLDPVQDLDNLPFPKWELFLADQEHQRLNRRHLRGLPIYSGRGCSFGCSYCPYVSFFGRTRLRKVENVYAEIEHVVKRWGIKRLLFRDPDFTENKKRIFAMLELIRRGGLGIQWSCETRLDLVDEELLKAMKGSGCIEIGTGIESANPEILSDVKRKAITDQRIREMSGLARRLGILIQGNYILGFPEDTETNMRDTVDYAKSLNTPLANFSIFTPYPGTGAWSDLTGKAAETDFQNYDLAHLVFNHPTLDNETVRRYYVDAYKSYYFRPSWFFKNFKPIRRSLLG
jgi:anaerobic magnesium-protoporphyrin IX monomethyl ester cyclase